MRVEDADGRQLSAHHDQVARVLLYVNSVEGAPDETAHVVDHRLVHLLDQHE